MDRGAPLNMTGTGGMTGTGDMAIDRMHCSYCRPAQGLR